MSAWMLAITVGLAGLGVFPSADVLPSADRSPSADVLPPSAVSLADATCPAALIAAGPEYYRFPLVSTGRVPGTGRATGLGELTFPSSPYGIALATDGSYRYDFTVRFQHLAPARTGTYVVWTTTSELDEVALAGELSEVTSFKGQVEWNKFLVVVTLEPAFDPDATMWSGPVVIRGMSRSGMMHTMAGHGAFEEEKCAAYGYE